MSDTGAAAAPDPAAPDRAGTDRGRARRRGCCFRLAIGLLLVLLALGAYVGWAASVALQPAPLDFEPFAWRPLERALLHGKLELQELPGRLMGSSSDVVLDARQLNGLLFGEAAHTAAQKARVLLTDDQLQLEVSAPTDRPGRYVNLVVALRVALTPGEARVEVVEGRLGGYELGPLTRPLLARTLTERLTALRAQSPELERLKAFWVEDGQAHLVYTPR